jgi:ATP-binding cassette, subfamily B, bacterial HlyB/CyaB
MRPGIDSNATDGPAPPEDGLAALVLLLRFHGIAADPAQIRHRFGGGAIGLGEMVRAARELKLRARAVSSDWRRLAQTPLPAIAERRGGSFVVLARRCCRAPSSSSNGRAAFS